MELGALELNDFKFQVADAVLQGCVSGPKDDCLLSVNVTTLKKKIDGERWEPRAYIERTRPWGKNLQELCETPLHIPVGSEFGNGPILPGGKLCCIYAFEHAWLNDVRLSLRPLAVGWFQMTWTARCTGVLDNWAMRIETPVQFLGFSIQAKTESVAARKLKRRFDLEGLTFYSQPGDDCVYFIPNNGS